MGLSVFIPSTAPPADRPAISSMNEPLCVKYLPALNFTAQLSPNRRDWSSQGANWETTPNYSWRCSEPLTRVKTHSIRDEVTSATKLVQEIKL